MISITDAAARLGISAEAVRKRVHRGAIMGRKIDGAWFIDPERIPDAGSEESAGRPDKTDEHYPDGIRTSGQDDPEPATVTPGGLDQFEPLVALIERLHAENLRLTEVATAWQGRATMLEQRATRAENKLTQLAAGDVPVSDQEADTRVRGLSAAISATETNENSVPDEFTPVRPSEAIRPVLFATIEEMAPDLILIRNGSGVGRTSTPRMHGLERT